jgi:hypothetical protein
MKGIKCVFVYKSLKIEEISTLTRRYVNCVERSIWRRKTSIGHAEHIDLTTEVKCGGAAVKHQRMPSDANTRNIILKKMKMRIWKGRLKRGKRIAKGKGISDAFAVRRRVMKQKIAREILI